MSYRLHNETATKCEGLLPSRKMPNADTRYQGLCEGNLRQQTTTDERQGPSPCSHTWAAPPDGTGQRSLQPEPQPVQPQRPQQHSLQQSEPAVTRQRN